MLLSSGFGSELDRDAVAAGAYWCSGLRRPDGTSALLVRPGPPAPARTLPRLLTARPREEELAPAAPADAPAVAVTVLGEPVDCPASAAGGRLSVT